jgi:hypothetical protein
VKASERQERFEGCCESLSEAAWLMAHEQGTKLILSFACYDEEPVHTQLDIEGFADDFADIFSIEQWNEQIGVALDRMPIWFAGLAFPFCVRGVENFIAVVAMDSMTASFTKIIMRIERGHKKPVRWEPLTPFPLLSEMLVVLRQHVSPQG